MFLFSISSHHTHLPSSFRRRKYISHSLFMCTHTSHILYSCCRRRNLLNKFTFLAVRRLRQPTSVNVYICMCGQFKKILLKRCIYRWWCSLTTAPPHHLRMEYKRLRKRTCFLKLHISYNMQCVYALTYISRIWCMYINI